MHEYYLKNGSSYHFSNITLGKALLN